MTAQVRAKPLSSLCRMRRTWGNSGVLSLATLYRIVQSLPDGLGAEAWGSARQDEILSQLVALVSGGGGGGGSAICGVRVEEFIWDEMGSKDSFRTGVGGKSLIYPGLDKEVWGGGSEAVDIGTPERYVAEFAGDLQE